MRSRRGFTLIELLVVVGLMGLLMAVSYPLLSHWTEGALRKGARQLTAAIELLHERAVTTRQLYRLRLELGKERYWLESLQGSTEYAEVRPVQTLPSGVWFRDLVDGRHVKLTEGEVAIYFYPIGRLDPVILHLEQSAPGKPGVVFSLVPHPLTGRVTVTEGDLEPAS